MKRPIVTYHGSRKLTSAAKAASTAVSAARTIQRVYRAYRGIRKVATRSRSASVASSSGGGPRKLLDGLTTVSSFANGYKLKAFYKDLLKTSAPSYQIIRFGRRMTSAINQYGNDIFNFLDTGFLQQMYTEIVPNAASSNQRVFLENLRVEMEFCNSGDQILTIEIYDVVCKKDTTTSPLTAMSSGFTTMDPQTALGNSANQTIDAGSLMFTPSMSPTFNQLYKIQKITKLNIPSGHIHKHSHNFSPRMILNETRRANASFYSGLTKHIMVRIRGQAVSQQDNATVIGIGPSALDVICMARAKVKYVAANRQTAWRFAGVDLGAVTVAEAMDPVNDVPDTFTST